MIDWATLSPWVPALLVLLALLVAALSVAAVLVARRTAVPADDPMGAAEGLELVYLGTCDGTTSDQISGAVHRAQREMRRSGMANAPQFLMLGESGAGKTTLLSDSGLPHPFGGTQSGSALDVWLFSETAVYDPKGELVLRKDGRSNDQAGWLCLLRQLKEARPRRPLDGIVLTIPATRLFVDPDSTRAGSNQAGSGEKDQAALQADASLRANQLFERLAELQQVLGMRLPVDVVITQSDHIAGWREFTSQLPLETQKQIFGWSSPYAPQAPYQASWTSQAFETITERLEEAEAAMMATGHTSQDPSALLDFPNQIAALEPTTRIYLNHLFSHSAFVESFMMRGLFFTGGAFDDAAALHTDVAGLCPPPPKPKPPPDRRHRAPDRLLFVRDLLRAKVFPENTLGIFTEQATRSAKVHKRFAQIAALLIPLLWLGGMLFEHGRIADDSAHLSRPVALIAADLRLNAQSPPTDDALVDQAAGLVSSAKTVPRYILRGLFLPPSWLSPQHGKVRGTFLSGYDGMVFPALHAQLGRWLKDLSEPWPPPPPGPHIAYVEETPEFLQLQAFSKQLTRFDDDVWLYDCLVAHCAGDSAALTAFDRLSRDLLDVPLDLPTAAARRFEAETLGRVEASPFGVTTVGRLALDAQTRRLFDRLDRRLFTENPTVRDLKMLNAEIERLELDPDATADDYRRLRDGIDALRKELEQPEIAWMGQDSLDPGPVVRATFDALALSPYVGKKTVDELEEQADEDFADMRTEMASISNPSTGTVLAVDDSGSAQLQLSQGVEDLDQSLATLLGEKFMAEEPQAKLQVPDDDERLFWNQNVLKKATDLVTSYQGFATDGVKPPFPQDLQDTTDEVALATLSENMLDTLAAAQSFRPAPSQVSSQTLERGLAMQVRNFTTNDAVLGQILDDFLALQLYDAYDQLTAVLTVQQTHMLGDLDALLGLEPLFEPVDESFAWWQGVQPPAPAAFGLVTPAACAPPAAGWCVSTVSSASASSSTSSSSPSSGSSSSGSSSSESSPSSSAASSSSDPCVANADSKAELESWTTDETATATHLSDAYAEPILGSPTALHLLPSKKLDQLTDTWQRFVTDVDQEKNKQPGNAIQTLSQFINDTMMQLSLGNCFDLLPDSASPSADYFRNRRSELVRGLGARCHQLAASYSEPDYRRYSKIFNERLAGRYPFVTPDPATPISSEATPAALRDFFASYDQSACLVVDAPAGTFTSKGQPGEEQRVRTFVAQMAEVRDFLAPFLDQPKKYPTPTYGYRVDFRVNQSREQGADQIIDWQLQVGDETQLLGLRTSPPPPPPPSSPTTTGGAAPSSSTQTALGSEWIFGEKSVLSLRWAQESPAVPTTAPTSDRARISDRTVIWDYRNLWSLLALVRDYEATRADFPATEDPQPETLKLTVGTETANASPKQGTTTAFVRITFLTPDFASELDVPGFPISAPQLTVPDFTFTTDEFDATFTNTSRGRWDSLLWRFGDGHESRAKHPTHTYRDAGSYDVTLELTTEGVTERVKKPVHIQGDPPSAGFDSHIDGLEVKFTDTSTGDPGPTSWSWSFGDSGTSSEQNPTHLYGAAGSYEVTLKVSNEAGDDVVKKTVTVEGLPPGEQPVARFRAEPEGGNFVRFIDESTGEIESRLWSFGDGKTSTEKNPGHLYESGGDYQVKLVVRGPGGEAVAVGPVTVR